MKLPKINKKYLLSSILIIICVLLLFAYYKFTKISKIEILPYPPYNQFVFETDENILGYLSTINNQPLYTIKKDKISKLLFENSSWIDDVYILKVFPNKLKIWVKEKNIQFCIKSNQDIWVVSKDIIIGKIDTTNRCNIIVNDNKDQKYHAGYLVIDFNLKCAAKSYKLIQNKKILSELFNGFKVYVVDERTVEISTTERALLVDCNSSLPSNFYYMEKTFETIPEYQKYKKFKLIDKRLIIIK